jgi:hypothetical protein
MVSGIKSLRDKVSVATGAASGTGRGFAERFAAEGMKVVLAEIEEGPLEEAVQISTTGAEAIGVRTDVRFEEKVQASRGPLDGAVRRGVSGLQLMAASRLVLSSRISRSPPGSGCSTSICGGDLRVRDLSAPYLPVRRRGTHRQHRFACLVRWPLPPRTARICCCPDGETVPPVAPWGRFDRM